MIASPGDCVRVVVHENAGRLLIRVVDSWPEMSDHYASDSASVVVLDASGRLVWSALVLVRASGERATRAMAVAGSFTDLFVRLAGVELDAPPVG